MVVVETHNRRERRAKGVAAGPAEELLWCGTPYIHTRTLLQLFLVWSLLLVVPVPFLVELIEDAGGWVALAWAVVSVFIFVPRVSRSSRVVYVLTMKRAWTSTRTMCDI